MNAPSALLFGLVAAALATIPASVAQDAPAPASITPPQPADLAEAKRLAVTTYAQLAEANYADALSQAIELRKDIKAFLAEPTVATHIAVKLSWVQARLPYLQTEAFRFYGGPIDDEDGPEGTLNAWPLDEAYIDYVDGSPDSGIIADAKNYPKLNPEVLAGLNERGGERNVATGYHAIEFLIWGQDLTPGGRGKRTYIDYDPAQNERAGRRGLYLLACSDLLVRQLADLLSDWRSGKPDNYRAAFEKQPTDEALQKILTGVGMLAGVELAGERLGVAYETMEQEEEQSCFSDTTHLDMLHDTAGMANVVAGAYVGLDGKLKVLGVGLVGVADKLSAKRGENMRTAINGALTAARGLKSPFDAEILEENPAGRARVKALIDAQNALAAEIVALAGDLGVKISLSPESE